MHKLNRPSLMKYDDDDDDDDDSNFGRSSNKFLKSSGDDFQKELKEKLKHRSSFMKNDYDDDDDSNFGRSSNRFLKSSGDDSQRELKNRRTPSPKQIETDSDVSIDVSTEFSNSSKLKSIDDFGRTTGFHDGNKWNSKADERMKRSERGLFKQNKLVEEKENDSEMEFDIKPLPRTKRASSRNEMENTNDIPRYDIRKKEMRSSIKIKESSDFEESDTMKKFEKDKKSLRFGLDDDEIEDPFGTNTRFLKSKQSKNDNKPLNQPKPRSKRYNDLKEDNEGEKEEEEASLPSWKRKEKQETELMNSTNFLNGSIKDDSFDENYKFKSDFMRKKSLKFDDDNDDEIRKERKSKNYFNDDFEQKSSKDIFKSTRYDDDNKDDFKKRIEERSKDKKESFDERKPKERSKFSRMDENKSDDFNKRKPDFFMKQIEENERSKSKLSNHESDDELSSKRNSEAMKMSRNLDDNDDDKRLKSKERRRWSSMKSKEDQAKQKSQSFEKEEDKRSASPATSFCDELEDRHKEDKETINEDKKRKDAEKSFTMKSKIINNGISEVEQFQNQSDKHLPPKPTKIKKKKNKFEHVTPRVTTFTNLRSISLSNLTGDHLSDDDATNGMIMSHHDDQNFKSSRSGGGGDNGHFTTTQSIREAAFINWYLNKKREGKLQRPKQDPEEIELEKKSLNKKKEKEEENKQAYEAWKKKKIEDEQKNKKKKDTKNESKNKKSADTAFEMWKKQKEIKLKEDAKKKKEEEEKKKEKISQDKEAERQKKEEKQIKINEKLQNYQRKEKERKDKEEKEKQEKEKEKEKKKEEAENKYFQWEMNVEERMKAWKEYDKERQNLVTSRKAWRPNSAKVTSIK